MALGTTRVVALVTAVAAVVFAVILAVAGPLTETSFTSVSYAGLSVTAGVVLVAAALSNRGRSRIAWSLVGAGVLCWGIGEIVWIAQAAAGEILYPGPADFFYVAGYPLMFAGIILLPHLRPGHFERMRLAIDAVAGTVSLGVVMWVAYLHQVVSVGSNPFETLLNLLYPFGDVLLATALMVLAMRRTEQRLDLRIVFLAAAVALTTAADVIFSLQVAAETYMDWGWLDALWLFSYGAFSFTAWLVTKPTKPSEHTYRAVRGWQLIAPYTAVAALFLTRLLTSTGSSLILNLATTGVAGLVIGRQGIALRERRELLERQRDDLVASVSHELRTPLTGIQGYSQILLEIGDTLSPAERREMVETIGTQATHLGRIVTDLIDVARDRLQNVKLHRGDYGAAELVREAVAAAAGGRKVATELDGEARVFADADRIRQVLVNLITNAVRYGRSKITVVTRIDNGANVFAVHDDGDGVPNKYQHTIFERFERGAHKFDSAVGGSGIGLSVGRDLVIAHGGEIRYRPSELLGGACFEFTLPATQPSLPDLVNV
ncbi:MAG: sensor histidine kinase [Acidimicrobiia bacterium]